MKYQSDENYLGGIILVIIVILATWFFINPINDSVQEKDCYDSGRGIICE